jgi:hypothetical protein
LRPFRRNDSAQYLPPRTRQSKRGDHSVTRFQNHAVEAEKIQDQIRQNFPGRRWYLLSHLSP